MSREDEAAVILRADATLTAILTGGIYTDEELGVEGIRRGVDSPADAAFDADGILLPCLLLREGSISPYGNVRNVHDKFSAISQLLSCYVFEFRGHVSIDLARARVFELLEGVRLGRSYPIWMAFESPVIPDGGPVANSSVQRLDWLIVSTRQVA